MCIFQIVKFEMYSTNTRVHRDYQRNGESKKKWYRRGYKDRLKRNAENRELNQKSSMMQH